jgi:arylsulfatase A-like enzyme
MARNGLRYNNFHTTALSSTTRAALKSGRNHHTVNMGFITEMATGFPGATGQIPNATAPVAEMLRLNGYSTAAFGKWHETAAWETSVSGPFDRWPTHQGMDKFYGFIGGETNQWAPYLYDGVTQVELPNDPNYHFMTDMTDKAVAWIKYQKAMTPDKPLFVYFAPGATRAPHHVPKEWIARWKGKFHQGWDKVREETFARQLKMGVIPEGTKLAPKPKAIKDWDKLSADEKHLFSHQAEVFAAYLDYTDHEIGRMLAAVEATGEADNTLVFYIAGDNGTSGEGGENGMFNEYTYFNGVHEQVHDLLKVIDKWGSPATYPHMAAGWSVAFDSPFCWMKQVASDFGGTRNGMVVSWPKGIKAKNEIRTQFSHVIDVAPTILEAAGLPEPKVVNGTPQIPMEGVSVVYTFNDAKAKERHTTQYFEIGGWSLYVKDGVPAYDYNFLGLKRYSVSATKPLVPGKATIKFDFAYDGGGLGKGGNGTLFVHNEKVAEGRIEHTQPMIFSADETADVGIDLGTPVVEAIGSEAKSRFTGKIPKVTIEVKEMKKADKSEEDKARIEAAHKKALSD